MKAYYFTLKETENRLIILRTDVTEAMELLHQTGYKPGTYVLEMVRELYKDVGDERTGNDCNF